MVFGYGWSHGWGYGWSRGWGYVGVMVGVMVEDDGFGDGKWRRYTRTLLYQPYSTGGPIAWGRIIPMIAQRKGLIRQPFSRTRCRQKLCNAAVNARLKLDTF